MSHLQIERVDESIGEHGTRGTSSSTTPWPDGGGLGLDSHCGLGQESVKTGFGVEDGSCYRCIDRGKMQLPRAAA